MAPHEQACLPEFLKQIKWEMEESYDYVHTHKFGETQIPQRLSD